MSDVEVFKESFNRWRAPGEIVPTHGTPMVNILTGRPAGTLGEIWERQGKPGYKGAYEEAMQIEEAPRGGEAEMLAYQEYEKREGHPHPLFAGSVATTETVEQPAEPAQPESALAQPTPKPTLVNA